MKTYQITFINYIAAIFLLKMQVCFFIEHPF